MLGSVIIARLNFVCIIYLIFLGTPTKRKRPEIFKVLSPNKRLASNSIEQQILETSAKLDTYIEDSHPWTLPEIPFAYANQRIFAYPAQLRQRYPGGRHNVYFVMKYDAHVNFEIVTSIKSVKYVFRLAGLFGAVLSKGSVII
jgi:hypothetical protein